MVTIVRPSPPARPPTEPRWHTANISPVKDCSDREMFCALGAGEALLAYECPPSVQRVLWSSKGASRGKPSLESTVR